MKEYRLKKDINVRVGVTVFTTPKGRPVYVKQEDKQFSKVLLDFGDGYIDWFHTRWLDQYAEPVETK